MKREEGKIVPGEGLTFADVLVLPGLAKVKREEIDLSASLSEKIKLSFPLVSSPMDTVTEAEMAIALGKLGGLGVIHRNFSIEDQVSQVKKAKKEIPWVAAAVGAGRDLPERVVALVKAGLDILVLDSAHGFSQSILSATNFLHQRYPKLFLIAGNVTTAAGAEALFKAGANALRVGMGPGAICTTRSVAGIGVPQLTAILETVKVAERYQRPVIADGGVRNSGDILKALVAGAKLVMSGFLFAGCRETPGQVKVIQGKKYKTYRGMGSLSAMKKGGAARYGQEYKKGRRLTPEGVEGFVPYQGKVKEVLEEILGGLRSGMYYAGAKNLSELQEKAKFIRISPASVKEGYQPDFLLPKYDFNC